MTNARGRGTHSKKFNPGSNTHNGADVSQSGKPAPSQTGGGNGKGAPQFSGGNQKFGPGAKPTLEQIITRALVGKGKGKKKGRRR